MLIPKTGEGSARKPAESSVGKPRPLPASDTPLALPDSAASGATDMGGTAITGGLSASCIANCLKEIENQKREIKCTEVQAKEKLKSIREATHFSGSFFCLVPAGALLGILSRVFFYIY
jgi:hypothetical protein